MAIYSLIGNKVRVMNLNKPETKTETPVLKFNRGTNNTRVSAYKYFIGYDLRVNGNLL